MESLRLDKFQKNALTPSQMANIFGGAVDTKVEGGTDSFSVCMCGDDTYDHCESYRFVDPITGEEGSMERTFDDSYMHSGYGTLGN